MPEQFPNSFTITTVDVKDTVEKQIADTAESRLTREHSEQKGLKGIVTRIKDGLTLEYRRHKERNKVKQEMLESGDILADNRTADASRTQHAKSAIVERFAEDASKEMIEQERGEQRELLTNTEFNNQLKAEIIDYVNKDFGSAEEEDEALRQMQVELVDGLFKEKSSDDRAHLLNYASNLTDVARAIRGQFRHEGAVANVKELQKINIDVIRGVQKQAVRTELQERNYERILSKAKTIPFLGQLLETSVGLISYSAIYYGAKSTVTGASKAALGLSGLAGGLIAGSTLAAIRAGHEMKIKRVDTMRQLAQGKEVGPDSPERTKFAEVSYNMVRASDLVDNLYTNIGKVTLDENRQPVKDAAYEAAVSNLIELQARLRLSQQRKIDLIGYSSVENAERENTNLLKVRAYAKSKLGAGLDKAMLDEAVAARMTELVGSKDKEGTIEAKDAQFAGMRRKRMAQAAGFAGVGAVLLGTLAQEAQAHFTDKLNGLTEPNNPASGTPDTALNGLRHLLERVVGVKPATHVDTLPGTGVKLTLPQGVDAVLQHKGGPSDPTIFSLRGPDGTIIAQNLRVDASGKMDAASLTALIKSGGFDVRHLNLAPTGGTGVGPQTSTIEEAIMHGKSQGAGPMDLHRFARRGWADNNTHKFDHAELGQYQKDAGGNLILQQNLNMRSFHGGDHYHLASAAASGQMSVFISPDRAHNHWGWEFKLDKTGNIVIPKDHPAHALFTENPNGGEPVFHGGFIEMVYHKVPNGHSRLDEYVSKGMMQASQRGPEGIVVSTVVGKNDVSTITFPGSKALHGYELIPPANVPESLPPAPIFTPQAERQLEKMRPVVERILPTKEKSGDGMSDQSYYGSAGGERRMIQSVKPLMGLEQMAEKYQIETRELEGMVNRALDDDINYHRGEKLHEQEFYDNSPIVKGIEQANEIVIILKSSIGDALLTAPIIDVLQRYLALTNQSKRVVVQTNQVDLFKPYSEKYPQLEVKSYEDVPIQDGRYIIDGQPARGKGGLYGSSDGQDSAPLDQLDRYLPVDHYSWTGFEYDIEESTTQNPKWLRTPDQEERRSRLRRSIRTIPGMIARNFELMLGMKLYGGSLADGSNQEEALVKQNYRLPESQNASQEKQEMLATYGLERNKYLLLSMGSAVLPKMFEPQQWVSVIKELFAGSVMPEEKDAAGNVVKPESRVEYEGKIAVIWPETRFDATYGDTIRQQLENELTDEQKSRLVWIRKSDNSQESLTNSAYLAESAQMTLTPDTGLGHVSVAAGGKVLMLFSAGNPMTWQVPNQLSDNSMRFMATESAARLEMARRARARMTENEYQSLSPEERDLLDRDQRTTISAAWERPDSYSAEDTFISKADVSGSYSSEKLPVSLSELSPEAVAQRVFQLAR